MTIKVYDVNAFNEPSTMIDSTDVQVLDVGFQAQKLMFSNPVAISDTFAISLEVNAAAPANPYYVTNTSANSDGNGERLSSAEYLGTWYNAFDDFAGWDMDILMSPIFTTDLTSLYTVGPTSVCPNDTITFLNVSSVNTDAMFNLYNGSSNPLYSWDFDDGTGPYTPFDTTYAYSAPGTYNTGLTVNYYGYSTNCFETSNVPVTVYDTAVAYFGADYLGATLFQMNDSSTNAMTYSWDFGDGSPVETTQNPQHTFLTFPAYVCLTVTDSNGCNSNTYCDTVVPTNINAVSNEVKKVTVFPIPANKHFYVNIPPGYYSGTLVVTDVVGKKLKSVPIDQQDKIKVLTDGMSSGIYFVSVDHLGERVFTQRIVVDK